jgi:TonB family protein
MSLHHKSIVIPLLLSLLFHGLLIFTSEIGNKTNPHANERTSISVTLSQEPFNKQTQHVHHQQSPLSSPHSHLTSHLLEKNFVKNTSENLLQEIDHYYEAWELDVLPRPLNNITPNYPSHAKEIGVTGEVTLELLIDEKGKIISIKIIDTAVPLLFDTAATEAFQGQPFHPAEIDSRPVKSRMITKVKFDETLYSAHP